MENNLYYTPEISEFNVGFEYERLWLHVEPPMWGKETFYLNDSHIKLMQYSLGDIEPLARVKYLDQSDIESLGWKFKDESHFIKDTWILRKFDDGLIIYLDYYAGKLKHSWMYEDAVKVLFEGTIKNKSQLKFIMKCLGILE